MRQHLTTLFKPFTNRRGLLLAGVVFLVYAWFYNGANVNQAARFDVAFSFVEPGTPYTGTFKINPFVVRIEEGRVLGNTIDWARNEAHGSDYYSNKPPLPSLLAIPVYATIYWAERGMGLDPVDPHLTYLNCYLINLCVTVLPMALSAVFAYALALTLVGHRRFPAFIICVGLYFGTLAFPFSTQLWGHTLGLACCVVGAYFAFADESKAGPVLAGFFFGLSVLCDFTCAIGVFALGLWFLGTRTKMTPYYVAGGAPALILYAAYHKMCFGSFLTPASSFSNPQFIDADGVGGLFNLASAMDAAEGLIVSPYRGIFWYMPCLLGIALVMFRWKDIKRKDLVMLGAGAALAYLLLNLSFNGWHGGFTSGPRYQIVALVWYFVLIAAGASCDPEGCQEKALSIVGGVCCTLLAISIANMFVITTVSPMAEEIPKKPTPMQRKVWSNPLPVFYKVFFKGINQISTPGFYSMRPGEPLRRPYRFKSFTLGKFMGLPGNVQTVPPMVFLILCLWLAYRWRGKDGLTDGDQPNRSKESGNEPLSAELEKN